MEDIMGCYSQEWVVTRTVGSMLGALFPSLFLPSLLPYLSPLPSSPLFSLSLLSLSEAYLLWGKSHHEKLPGEVTW